MKKLTLTFLTILVFLGGFVTRTRASMDDALIAAGMAKVKLEAAGYDVIVLSKDVFKKGQEGGLTVNLTEGNTYSFVVVGCKDATDVDIGLFPMDRRGNVQDKPLQVDTEEDEPGKPIAVITNFAAPYTGKYWLAVRLANSTTAGAHL